MWDKFMNELRHEHLGASPAPSEPTVRATLQAGYDAVIARNARSIGCDPAP
ncbi:MAG: transcriptional regulator, partial [Mesorhizobium sp.]